MNRFLVVTSIFLAGLGQVEAACPTNRINGNAITTLLSGNTVCVGSSGNWEFQEMHAGDGTLSDYKLGSDPMDPTEVIGKWARNGNNVQYDYTGGSSFSYEVYSNSATAPAHICLVGAKTVEGDLKAGLTGCN